MPETMDFVGYYWAGSIGDGMVMELVLLGVSCGTRLNDDQVLRILLHYDCVLKHANL